MKNAYRINKAYPLLAALLVLAGCSLAPTYERPAAPVPAGYKEAAVAPDQWKTAEPAEHQSRGTWWSVFNDADLDRLELQAADANQDLKAAAARLAQARTFLKTAEADRFPQVDVGFGPTREKPSAVSLGLPDGTKTPITTTWRAQIGASYEVDLFGRVADSVKAAGADVQRSEALFESVRLALQADVAQAYFLIREQDAESALYVRTVDLREQTVNLLQKRFSAGDIGELDLARGKTELASARSEALAVTRRRAEAEHALAVLLGQPPADFAFTPKPIERMTLTVPSGLPSSLLERRPDIAAAERAMAASNARVGVAKSAFFPSLILTGAAGYESADLSELLKWSSRTFLVGPLVGTMLSLPIFDGGRRQAGLDRARAVYEEDVASYRQTVLGAFREVEDGLSALRYLDEQIVAQDQAVSSSARAAQLSLTQYKEGAISYLDVMDSDRNLLAQQRLAAQIDGERARSTVDLIRALGGGWHAGDMAATRPAAERSVADVR